MKKFLKLSYVPAMLAVFMAAPVAHAATSPSLGAAASYSILAGSEVTNSGFTTVSGNVGISPGIGAPPHYTGFPPGVVGPPGTIHDADASALAAQTAQKAVFDTDLAAPAQPCTVTYPGTTELSTAGPLVPGVYCTPAATDFTLSGTLTLQGTGSPSTDVWIFRSSRDLISSGTANVVFTGTGGLPCNVWWRISNTATFTGSLSMVGNILAATSITFGTNTTLNGRAFAYTAEVTHLTNTISGPTCAAAIVPPLATNVAPLIHVTKVPNPLALPLGPGPVTYTYVVTNPGTITMSNITLIDDQCSAMVMVSGDTNGNGLMETTETWNYTCSMTLPETTLNFATARGIGNGLAAVDTAIAYVIVGVPVIPPLINILKTPSPLSLPSGGGTVTYNYAVTNPGTVALTSVTVTDDKCSTVTYVSGDVNGDSQLQATETWNYSCIMNVPLTSTNTAIATGHANGLTAIDTALATVVVAGLPVPPLIHIIKKPLPIILPSGGGVVTYTYTVTNPGTVTLSNLSVSDDRCSSVTSISGDANGNAMMETSESWTYTCTQNVSVSTINTATAQGTGNGLTVTDVAVASVPVSAALIPPPPSLPNTGFGPGNNWIILMVASAGLFVAGTLLFAVTKGKRLFS